MADDIQDNEKRQQLLKAKLMKLKSLKEELKEQKQNKETLNSYLTNELAQKQKDFELLGKYVTSGFRDDTLLDKKQQYGSSVTKLLEKSVLEKFSYHTDKYFRHIEDCINRQEQEQANMKDDDNQYQAPPPTCAIQIKLVKTCLPKDKQEMGVPGDDPDYVTQTFRYTKQDTFNELKQSALKFWGLIEVRNMHSNNNQKSNVQQSEIQQEGGEQSKVSEGNGVSGLNSSQQSKQITENDIRRVANRYEIVTDDLEPISNTNYIERFLTEQIANVNKNALCVVLRKKKTKQSHKKGGEGGADGKSQGMSQVKSYGVSHGQSSQIGTQTNQQGASNNQSKVSGEEQQNQQQQYNQLEEDDDDENQDDAELDEEKRKLKISLYKKFATFFKRFPLLKKMFMIDSKDVESRGVMIDKEIKQDKKGMTCDDNNFCVILILMTLFVLNLLFSYYLQDGPYAQTNYSRLTKLLNVGAIGTTGSYRDISKISDIYSYFTNVSGVPYQLMAEASDFRQSFDIVGALRIRQIRTKPSNCTYPQRNDKVSQISCVYDQVTSSTIQTSLIGDGSQSWMQFKSVGDTGISRISQGTFDDYDSSGYILDVMKDDQTLLNYKNKVIKGLFDHPAYLAVGFNAQIMTFSVRSRNDGSFIFLEFLIEYTNSGIIANIPKIVPFNLNLVGQGVSQPYSVIAQQQLQSPENPIEYEVGLILYLITVAKVFTGIFFTFFQLIKIKTYITDSKVKGLKYFISITFVLNCCILYITFKNCDLVFKQNSMNYDAVDLFQSQKFVDLGDLADYYSSAVFTNTIGLCLTALRIFLLFNFLRSFEAALSAIEQYYLQIFASLFILAFVLVGYTMISMSIYGQQNNAFSTFIRAFTSLLLILTQCQDQSTFYKNQINLGTIYVIIFYFIFSTFMFNIMAVMYIDSYRIIIVDQGELVQDSWSTDDIFKFLTTWIPEGCKKKFNKALAQAQTQIKE